MDFQLLTPKEMQWITDGSLITMFRKDENEVFVVTRKYDKYKIWKKDDEHGKFDLVEEVRIAVGFELVGITEKYHDYQIVGVEDPYRIALQERFQREQEEE